MDRAVDGHRPAGRDRIDRRDGHRVDVTMVTVPRFHPRAGYALLATLWMCVGIGALTWLIAVNAQEAMASSRNRMALTAGLWRAQACLVFEREALRDKLSQGRMENDSTGSLWNYVDRLLHEAPPPLPDCSVSARPVGARVNINTADEATLTRLLQAAGWTAPRADSAAAALADWIDADDQPRPNGAERDSYLAQNREPPSNAPLVDMRELRRVRGFEGDQTARLDSILDVEPGAIALNEAPREVLSLLPGFNERTIHELLDARASGSPVTAFIQLRPWLDPAVPDASAKLPGIVLLAPEAWIVTARVRTGNPLVTTVLELRLARGNGSTIVGRRRAWTE
jgi:general secretion pathway protein K